MNRQTFEIWAKEAGFAEIGFCDIDDFSAEAQIVAQQEALSERRQLRFTPREDHPQVKSIAVLLWPYLPAKFQRDELFIDSYYEASNAAYHAAKTLEERLNQNDIFAKANVSYPAKAAAVRAGLGIVGKNSLLITPAYGTRVVIILMAVGITMNSCDSDHTKSSCLNCGRCIAVCPMKALDEQGMSHPERCLRNYMLEGNVVPREHRGKIDMRLLGCDLCQRACPMQPPFSVESENSQFQLDSFVTDDTAMFSRNAAKLAEKIGRNTARPQRIRAQAAILAGNSRDPRYLPVLQQWVQSDFEAVRIHAKWAIQKIEEDGRHS